MKLGPAEIPTTAINIFSPTLFNTHREDSGICPNVGRLLRNHPNTKPAISAPPTEIDSEEWTPLLHALGLESTLEVALNMAMIKEGLTGNVKAYEAIARYSGQSDRTDTDQEEQQVRMAAAKARYGQPDEDEEEPDDGFLDALKDAGDWDGWEQDMEEPEGSGQEGDGDETEEGTADI